MVYCQSEINKRPFEVSISEINVHENTARLLEIDYRVVNFNYI